MIEDTPVIGSDSISNERLNEPSSDHYNYGQNLEDKNDYSYYQNTNLTYPRINSGSPPSPKRLSLDDRYY